MLRNSLLWLIALFCSCMSLTCNYILKHYTAECLVYNTIRVKVHILQSGNYINSYLVNVLLEYLTCSIILAMSKVIIITLNSMNMKLHSCRNPCNKLSTLCSWIYYYIVIEWRILHSQWYRMHCWVADTQKYIRGIYIKYWAHACKLFEFCSYWKNQSICTFLF